MLGCTHYPFLRRAIRKLLGDSITLIDTSDAVVRQLKRQLELQDKLIANDRHGDVTFISSKDGVSLATMARELMHSDLNLHDIYARALD